jgi:hypothetical protein
MMKPTIHLNGTSRAALLEAYEIAARALVEATEALVDCAPNGRDYYPQGPDALGKAQDEHIVRITSLGVIRREIMELSYACREGATE